MVALPELVAILVLLFAIGAEYLHARRVGNLQALVFGPGKRPAPWVRSVPILRALSLTAMAWAMLTLMQLPPKAHKIAAIEEKDKRHMIVVLDVSPSMRLVDAGPEEKQSRKQRAASIMHSFFARVSTEMYRISVVAFYTDAKPVVEDTSDMDVVNNIFNDLPMQYAFESGETDLFAGIEGAAQLSRRWNPKSTTLIIISDGDTVPSTGMPTLPASIADVVVVGVGDISKGMFIDGHQSRQDSTTLRQVAIRLGGVYHNGNEKHLPTDLIKGLAVAARVSPFEELTKREYALFALGIGGVIYTFLPLVLHYLGTAWKPGVPLRTATARNSRRPTAKSNLPTLTQTQ